MNLKPNLAKIGFGAIVLLLVLVGEQGLTSSLVDDTTTPFLRKHLGGWTYVLYAVFFLGGSFVAGTKWANWQMRQTPPPTDPTAKHGQNPGTASSQPKTPRAGGKQKPQRTKSKTKKR